jgi:hypothetical protein
LTASKRFPFRNSPGTYFCPKALAAQQLMETFMADNSGTGALGVLVGALLVIVLVGGGLYMFNQGGGGSKGPSITIGAGK